MSEQRTSMDGEYLDTIESAKQATESREIRYHNACEIAVDTRQKLLADPELRGFLERHGLEIHIYGDSIIVVRPGKPFSGFLKVLFGGRDSNRVSDTFAITPFIGCEATDAGCRYVVCHDMRAPRPHIEYHASDSDYIEASPDRVFANDVDELSCVIKSKIGQVLAKLRLRLEDKSHA